MCTLARAWLPVDHGLRLLDIFSPPDIEENAREQLMGIVALPSAMLQAKLLQKIQIEYSVVPGSADIFAQSRSQWMRVVETGLKVRIEQVPGPQCERGIEASFGGIARFEREEFFE